MGRSQKDAVQNSLERHEKQRPSEDRPQERSKSDNRRMEGVGETSSGFQEVKAQLGTAQIEQQKRKAKQEEITDNSLELLESLTQRQRQPPEEQSRGSDNL